VDSNGKSLIGKVLPFALEPIPLGVIKPRGWLRDNINGMADGLPGHMHDFYGYVRESPWLGGTREYSGLHEAFPYWLNGIVPLAYGLDDPVRKSRLQQQISESVKFVVANQHKDGWLGSETKESGLRNLWARFPLLLGFKQLLEADFETYGSVLLPVIRKFVDLSHNMLLQDGYGMVMRPGDKLSEEDHGWGQVRMADYLITLQWLYEHDVAGKQQSVLYDTMKLLRKYSLDWDQWYTQELYPFNDLNTYPKERIEKYFAFEHGVNVGQGLKTGAVINRFENNQSMVELSRRAVDWTFQYHGSTSGTVLGDERLEGLDPFYGSELCMTVETMYSLSYLYQASGDATFADRAELAAFNALPAAVTGDWWAHQYLTQPNQPYSKVLDETPFWNVKPNGQTFGLEPNYPCCTVNHPQGYPKFLSHSWVKVGNDGLGHALLSPTALTTTLGNGANVTIDVETNYPFDDVLTYNIQASKPFTLYLRIPSWTDKSQSMISTPTSKIKGVSPDSVTGLQGVSVQTGKSVVTLSLSRSIRTTQRNNGAVAIFQGPFLFTLDVGHAATSKKESNPVAPDAPSKLREWKILPENVWNVAVDLTKLKDSSNTTTDALPDRVWAYGAPPNRLEAEGCEIEWPFYKGVPGPVPKNVTCKGKRLNLRFLPVGSAKIGMTELPTL
jgi:hypothetical protein